MGDEGEPEPEQISKEVDVLLKDRDRHFLYYKKSFSTDSSFPTLLTKLYQKENFPPSIVIMKAG